MINSQHMGRLVQDSLSISKGMGDQFSAALYAVIHDRQYIKGDG